MRDVVSHFCFVFVFRPVLFLRVRPSIHGAPAARWVIDVGMRDTLCAASSRLTLGAQRGTSTRRSHVNETPVRTGFYCRGAGKERGSITPDASPAKPNRHTREVRGILIAFLKENSKKKKGPALATINKWRHTTTDRPAGRRRRKDGSSRADRLRKTRTTKSESGTPAADCGGRFGNQSPTRF